MRQSVLRGGADDGACEREGVAFCCTSILGQQRVFSGYASEKCSHNNKSVVSLRGMGIMIRLIIVNRPTEKGWETRNFFLQFPIPVGSM